jgi:hypothetical protein
MMFGSIGSTFAHLYVWSLSTEEPSRALLPYYLHLAHSTENSYQVINYKGTLTENRSMQVNSNSL